MAKQVKYLKQIISHLKDKYGDDKANTIIDKAYKRYDELLRENKDEPKAYYMHTRERIYPAIATFDAMLAEGIDRNEIIEFLIDYYKWRASSKAPYIRAIFKIPGLYRIVPKFFMSMTKNSFGTNAGFVFEDQYLSKDEMRFNMKRCPYLDNCLKYGCPEIVKGFCDADDICYGDMHPKISWDRTKTLGYGNDECDFKIHIKGSKE